MVTSQTTHAAKGRNLYKGKGYFTKLHMQLRAGTYTKGRVTSQTTHAAKGRKRVTSQTTHAANGRNP